MKTLSRIWQASLAMLLLMTCASAHAYSVTYIVKSYADRLPSQPAGIPSMADGDGDGCTSRKASENIRVGYVKYKDCPPFPGFGTTSRIVIQLPDVTIPIVLKAPLTFGTGTDVRIDGNGAAFDGIGLTRLIEANSGPALIWVSDTEFTGGNGDNGGGGAIKIGSSSVSLILEDTIFVDNVASQGGAVHSAGSVTIFSSSFLMNIASSPTVGTGGAIFAGGMLQIHGERAPGPAFNRQTRFEGNEAELGGGAIHCSSGEMHATEAEFKGNRTRSKFGSYGGGAILNGIALGTGGCELDLYRTRFIGNETAGPGGAIRTGTTAGVLISLTSFESNRSSRTLLGGSQIGVGGGAIATHGSLEVSQSSFTNNSTTSLGGAILVGNAANNPVSVANSTFVDNRASLGIVVPTNYGSAIAVHGNAKGELQSGVPVGVLIYNNTIVDSAGANQIAISGQSPSLQPKVMVSNNLQVYASGTTACDVAPGADVSFSGNVESPGINGASTCSPTTAVANPNLVPAASLGWPAIKILFPLAAQSVNVGDQAVCDAPPVNDVDIRGAARGALCLAGSVTL